MLLSSSPIIFAQTLHIYGGMKHDVYLGCLNCNKYHSSSIWNAYGEYGSKYNSKSIWNVYGTYGSKYNLLSPWNAFSDNPPIIVDSSDSFYGYFTVNKYRYQRADFTLALTIYKYHNQIKDDVSNWYDKIFN